MRKNEPFKKVHRAHVSLTLCELAQPLKMSGGWRADTWGEVFDRFALPERLPLADVARLRTVRILCASVS